MKVSVIIAAYNVEDYIERCINSVINQSINDIEIIIVNDGSTDNTLEVISRISKRDNRISIINQKNQGVMKARCNGYIKAIGEYILFVDGDDWLREDALELLYNKSKKSNCDILCYKFIYIDEEGEERKSHINNDFITFNMIQNDEFLKGIMLFKVIPSIWSKFIRKKFIDDNSIELYNDLKYAEDIVVSCILGMYNPDVYMLDDYLYYYYQRRDSVTKVIDYKILDIEKAVNKVKIELNKRNIYYDYKEEFEYLSFIQNYFERLNLITNFENKYSKTIYKIWKKYRININDNKYINNKISMQSKGYRV